MISLHNTTNLRYMKQRCSFLDNLPSFNYNMGAGKMRKTYVFKKVKKTHTSPLGSTLMQIMLSEASVFCNPSIKENWIHQPHKQVLQHVIKNPDTLKLNLAINLFEN